MEAEVLVHAVTKKAGLLRANQRALFLSPQMKVFEEPTAFLSHIYRRNPSSATGRNMAYAMSYWFNFCISAEIDWRHSSIDDLYDYKDVLESTVSAKTGDFRSEGTVTQYLLPVIEFYDFASTKKWYLGDIRKEEVVRASSNADIDSLAHLRSGPRGTTKVSPIPAWRNRSSTIIRPLAIASLRSFLTTLGVEAIDGSQQASVRNRLIADWGWAVGLRLSEILSLEARLFEDLVVEELNPWKHFSIEVRGKGGKHRLVSVPSWLISNTQIYIAGERARCLASGGTNEQKLFVSQEEGFAPGMAITPRRVEAIFEAAYLKAGLAKTVARIDPESGVRSNRKVAAHCVHDLRHTYAVLTYHSELAAGNPEPWKKIQAQLGHSSLRTTVDIYLEYVNAHNDFRHGSVRDLIGLPRHG